MPRRHWTRTCVRSRPTARTHAALLFDHARQVRKHVARLGAKAYWTQFSSAPDFVVMFLPGEAFFGAALEQDPALVEVGAEQRVIVATPTTLIALLRAVAHGWREEAVAANARTVADLGAELHRRLTTFLRHIDALGRSLETSVRAYNRAVGSLESRVLSAARRLGDLGADSGGELATPAAVETLPRPAATDPRSGAGG